MLDRHLSPGPADPRHSKTVRRPSSAHGSRSLDVGAEHLDGHMSRIYPKSPASLRCCRLGALGRPGAAEWVCGGTMNLVSFALRRPISLLTMVLAVALVGFLALDRMSRDIFPDLGVPVLYVAQPYGGMDPAQLEGFIVNYYEYHFLYITGIEHVESKSIQA